MCGLVGIVGQYPNKEKNFRTLLMLDSTRGEHSTGVAIRVALEDNRAKTRIAKAEGLPNNLYERFPGLFDKVGNIREINSKERIHYILGHNRFATVGALTMENAHPFSVGSIVGAHNGTVKFGLHNLKEGEFKPKGVTDSEKMYTAMANGMSLQEIVNTVDGAIAFSWFDSKDNTFNLFRNAERPLFYSTNPAETYLAYASEDWMLRVTNHRAKNGEINKSIKPLPVDTHLKLKLSDTGIILGIEQKEVKKAPPVYAARKVEHNLPLKDHEAPKYLEVEWINRNFRHENHFNQVTVGGCGCCGTPVTYQEHLENKVFWASENIFFCEDCADIYGEV